MWPLILLLVGFSTPRIRIVQRGRIILKGFTSALWTGRFIKNSETLRAYWLLQGLLFGALLWLIAISGVLIYAEYLRALDALVGLGSYVPFFLIFGE